MKKFVFLAVITVLAMGLVYAQQDIIFRETFGTPNNPGYDNPYAHFEGNATLSQAYYGVVTPPPYPQYSGPYFLEFASNGTNLTLMHINTLAHENITLSYGLYKSTDNNPAFSVTVWDGNQYPPTWHTIWSASPYTGNVNYDPNTDNWTGWKYFEFSLDQFDIPPTDNLWFKFTCLGPDTRLLDDIMLSADTNGGTVPVELSSFTATISARNNVLLTWVTQTETDMLGYYVYRGTVIDGTDAQIVSPLIQATNSSQQQTYIFEDTELFDSGLYYYWLQANDLDGSSNFHGPVSVLYGSSGDQPTPEIPLITQLNSAYPNPFNPTVFIPFSLAEDGAVSFKIYNNRGQMVKQFDLGVKTAGHHSISWDGTGNNGKTLANGVYTIMMTTQNKTYQSKAALLK